MFAKNVISIQNSHIQNSKSHMKQAAYFALFILLFACNIPEQESEEKIPNDYFYRQRAYPTGNIDKQAYLKALQYKKAIVADRSIETRSGSDWELAGPLNVGGRVTDIEMFADNQQIIFVATASGGIFRSDNQGADWQPIFDETGSLSIGDMALAPSDENIIYVGTGEANAGGNSLAYDGVGVYRSDDAGTTWQHLGLESIGSIGKVVVDHANPERVFVAGMGSLFANNDERGVYRSEDGGTNWEQILSVSDSTGAIDLAIHPNDGNLIYAAMWERIRRPDRRDYGGATSGLYRSKDGGDTWEELTAGLPITASQKGRIGIAIAPSAPNVLYAMYVHAENGGLQGIYRSDNGGDTWRRVSIQGIDSPPFVWWFGKVFVSPHDENHVFATSLNMFESRNGGNVWQIIDPSMHVDQHSVFVHPQNENLRLFGNDGGIYLQNGANGNAQHLLDIPITQFYACAIDFQNPERLYGGTQDNGTVRTRTGRLNDWGRIFGGDGFTPLIDPTNSNVIYAQFQYGNLARSTNGGNNFNNITFSLPSDARRNWNMPVLFDPNNSNTLFIGANRVYRSFNRGDSWTALGPDLTNGLTGGNLTFATITSLSISRLNTAIIYAGTDDGNVQVSTNGGLDWTKVSENLPTRWVTSVFASPLEEGTAYVTFSGYRYGSYQGHVFKTTNFGTTWEDISSNLPDLPVNDILQNPSTGLLYLATDIGVFYSSNEGSDWDLLGENLPTVVVTDLKLHEPTQMLVAATYGRSLHKIDVSEPTSTRNPQAITINATAFPNPFQDRFQLELTLAQAQTIRLGLYDVQGRQLRTIFDGRLEAGQRNFSIETAALPSGIYYCHIKSDKTRVLTLVKE